LQTDCVAGKLIIFLSHVKEREAAARVAEGCGDLGPELNVVEGSLS
jgi:hypothetical protein